jgi:putative nucleotidyltransferase with HDIG domain
MANKDITKPGRWIAPSPRKPLAVVRQVMRRSDVWTRIGLCVVTGLVLWLATSGWNPGFPYRARRVPLHYPHARVAFSYIDAIETSRAQERVRRSAMVYYSNDEEAINELRQALVDRIFQIKDKKYEEIDEQVWSEFLGERFRLDAAGGSLAPPVSAASGGETAKADDRQAKGETRASQPPASPEKRDFLRFVNALANDASLDAIKLGLDAALEKFVNNGLLENLEHEFGQGSTLEIMVYPHGQPNEARRVEVSQVRIGELADDLYQRIRLSLDNPEKISDPQFVADRIYDWLRPRLPTTLSLNQKETERSLRRAEAATPAEYRLYTPGSQLDKRTFSVEGANYITADQPLGPEDIALLQAEHQAFINSLTLGQHVLITLANWGMYVAVFSLICGYLYYRDRGLMEDLRQFSFLLALFMVTVITCWILSVNVNWRAEIIPVCMFCMTVAIAWNRELALLLGALVSLVYTVSHGYGMDEFVSLAATGFGASLLCGRIRSRTRLVYIGLVAAAVALPTTLGAGIMLGQPLSSGLVLDGLWFSGGALLAGLFMTALLPFLENWFGLQTDISLLELSDANHPLLKQLVQRAPGTYNHSINVASIAEAAAEAIGANGLLCRVGAYFHDIGKMRKPEYFVENQGSRENKHDELVPTMSTLVIIAHVKDGAEMARRHHLPKPIIDIIEQHHGTTLVEYFYHQATRKSEDSGEAARFGEADFRYPGPKPQTPEAAVMMLADSVESASRALREPTPARLEGLVESLSKKKLDDGQFDQCSLTLQQLRVIEYSLIKSLNAMYHARVKYPDQQPA